MLRVGYLKVDHKGLFGKDLYVAGERVERVSDDTVHLGVSHDDLTAGS